MGKKVDIVPVRYGKNEGMWVLIVDAKSWLVSGSVGLAIYTILKMIGYI